MQRCLFLFLSIYLICSNSLWASDKALKIDAIYPEYLKADSFDSIQEFFTGEENFRGRFIWRSQNSERAGLYFHIALQEALTQYDQDILIKITYQKSGEPKPCELLCSLKTPLPKESILLIGLTGNDWSKSTRLNAWKLEFLSAEGTILAHAQSHVWASNPTQTANK